jgi:hypothetical protein
MFESERDLLIVIEKHDQLIHECASEKISFSEFLEKYNTFYMTYALDGHESDVDEQNLLKAYEYKIAPHREVWEKIIAGGLCSDEDAIKEAYIQAGRFGSDEGLRRLKEINNRLAGATGQKNIRS